MYKISCITVKSKDEYKKIDYDTAATWRSNVKQNNYIFIYQHEYESKYDGIN